MITSEEKREYMKKWRAKNAEHVKAYSREYEKTGRNPESIEKKREYFKKWSAANPNARREWAAKNKDRLKEYQQEYGKQWRAANPRYATEYVTKRRAENEQYRLAGNLRSRLGQALRNNQKVGSAVADLGCSIGEFKLYIENQFDSTMTWDNYGKVWELDHVIPLKDFDLTDRTDLLEACSWLNIRPLDIAANRGRCN